MNHNDKYNIIELYDALVMLNSKDEVRKFILDLCTPQEIKVLIERWKVAQLLAREELSYREINNITGASLTTIGRVARFLKEEQNQGYKLILDKIRRLQ